MNTLTDFLEHWAARQPDHLLFEFRDSRGKPTERHTYASFHRRTLELSAHLLKTALRKGDRVLLAYPPGLEGIAALLACARVGLIGVPVPLPMNEKDAAHRRLLAVGADCAPAAVLSQGLHLARLNRMIGRSEIGRSEIGQSEMGQGETGARHCRFLDSDTLSGPCDVAPVRDDGETLLLQYTSGSTGHPRGVVVTHRNVIANARATIDHVPRGVSWLPQHHDMGLIGFYLFPIVMGGANVGFAPLDFLRRPALWLRLISDVGATISSSPNFGYAYCLRDGKISDSDLDSVDLSSLRVLMNASEPACAKTSAAFQHRFGRHGLRPEACTVAYGLAENTLTVAHGGHGFLRLDRQSLGSHCAVLADDESLQDTIQVACCGAPGQEITVRICAPGDNRALSPLAVGEIQVAGPSVTPGYWRKEFATGATPADSAAAGYLATGDLGFMHEGKLYVCGRLKDLIIVGGVNYYPSDIEAAVILSPQVSLIDGACAFQAADGCVVVLVEAAATVPLPDPAAIAEEIRMVCAVAPHAVLIVARNSIVKTTSGKIARAATKERVASGSLTILARYEAAPASLDMPQDQAGDWRTRLRAIFTRYGLLDDARALGDAGLDSLSLVELQLEIESLLTSLGAGKLIPAMNGTFLQRLSLENLLAALAPLDQGSAAGISLSHTALTAFQTRTELAVRRQMCSDSRWSRAHMATALESPTPGRDILLTGATGFFGPFLLTQLLRQTDLTIFILVRATNRAHAFARIEAALVQARLMTPALLVTLRQRVEPVCGDLTQPLWGLSHEMWSTLANRVREIFHNGACVNYVMTYEAMRATNVGGTRTAVDLACQGPGRILHLISSTFIFGWTAKGIIHETDGNDEMQGLDFGYSQSKWTAEQLAFAAAADGLDLRVYRPALISVSTAGWGDSNDVAVRLLAFMIKHGIAADTPNQLSILPADVIAHNIVGISRLGRQASPALHVVADRYYSMKDLTQVISRVFGHHFKYYDILGFIEQLNRHCSPQDPIYPLLDFFNRSADKMAAMQLKRYSSAAYQDARSQVSDFRSDPSLEDTARYIMRYLTEQGFMPDAPARPLISAAQ